MKQSESVQETLKEVNAIIRHFADISDSDLKEYTVATLEADQRMHISVTATGEPIDAFYAYLTSTRYIYDYKSGRFGKSHLNRQAPPIPRPTWTGARHANTQQARTILFAV